MPRPFSITQIDKLGERLRKSKDPEEGDLESLQHLRASYDDPMAAVEEKLRALGLDPVTSRLKTVGTIIDKLKRDATRLSKMQDIAGVRHVGDMSQRRQNVLAAQIVAAFPGANLIDRRESPNNGYRAVHIVVAIEGCPIEIQLRTHLQDLWAQIVEKLGDALGRGIRYGEFIGDEERELIEGLVKVSQGIAKVEGLMSELEGLEEVLAHAPSADELSGGQADHYTGVRGYYHQQRETVTARERELKQLLENLLAKVQEVPRIGRTR